MPYISLKDYFYEKGIYQRAVLHRLSPVRGLLPAAALALTGHNQGVQEGGVPPSVRSPSRGKGQPGPFGALPALP